MAGLPEGITTALVHMDAPVSFIGDEGSLFITITPSVPLVWAATGTPIANFVDSMVLDPGVELQVQLPHVDQPGFQDGLGNWVTGWYYTIKVVYDKNGQRRHFPEKDFQVLSGQNEVDVALVPAGVVPTIPVIAPILPVTSIGGFSGTVTLSDLELENVDNTPDAEKPLSALAVQALGLKLDKTQLDRPAALTAANVAGRWDDTLSTFNLTTANTRRLTAGRARALAGTGLLRVAFAGDSTEAGYRANYATEAPSWVAAQALVASGLPLAGYTVAGNKGGAYLETDPRWALTGAWAGQEGNHLLVSSASGATATYTSTNPGTIVELVYLDNSGPFTYSIDGGAPVTVTPGGTNTLKTLSVTGLADKTHSIRVVKTSAAATYLAAATVRYATGLLVGNFGINSSSGWHWGQVTDFYSAGALVAYWAPDVAVLNLGINDYAANATADQFSTWQQQTLAKWPNADKIIATSNNVDNADYLAYNTKKFQLGASLNVPVVDVGKVMGTYAQAAALSLMFEQVHPNSTGYAVKGDLYARVLGATAGRNTKADAAATTAALKLKADAAAVAGAVRGTALTVYGHSYTPVPGFYVSANGEWSTRLATKLGMTRTSYGASGARMVEMAARAIGNAVPGIAGNGSYPAGKQGIIVLECEMNDALFGPATAEGRNGFTNALRSFLAAVTAEQRIEASEAIASGTWNTFNDGIFSNGSVRWTDQPNQPLTFENVTAPGGKVYILTTAHAAGQEAGTIKVSVDGVDQGISYNGIGQMATFTGLSGGAWALHSNSVITVNVPAGGVHTVAVSRAVGDSWFPIYVDALCIPSATPPPVLVCLDPPVGSLTSPENQANWAANSPALHAIIRNVAAEFPSAVVVDLGVGWDATIHAAATDTNKFHPGDAGMQHIADTLESPLLGAALTRATRRADVEIGVFRSPNGTRFRLGVDDAGALTVTSL
jgi:lysophospholipase L1-like esterase